MEKNQKRLVEVGAESAFGTVPIEKERFFHWADREREILLLPLVSSSTSSGQLLGPAAAPASTSSGQHLLRPAPPPASSCASDSSASGSVALMDASRDAASSTSSASGSSSSGSSSVDQRRRKKNMRDDHRFGAYLALKALSKDREVLPKDKELVAELLDTSGRTVERIWREANKQIARGEEVDVSSKTKQNSGRKRKDLGLERIPTIPLNKRSIMRALALSLNVAYTTLQRRFVWGDVRRHTSTLKPNLKPANKLSRVKFCISKFDQGTLCRAMPSFNEMHNIVHIAEKWFDMTKKKRTYYLHPEETDSERNVQNKNCIGKVMFLCAMTRPRFDTDGVVTFDGKLGVWAFVKEIPAARKSKNRDMVTMELKSVIVNRDVMREYLCEKVIPAIEAQLPMMMKGSFTSNKIMPEHMFCLVIQLF